MRFASDPPIPLTLTIVDQGNIFRSKVIGFFLRQALKKSYFSHMDADDYPIIRTARVKSRRPENENITQYEFWKNDEEAFRRLFEDEFNISVADLEREESVEVTRGMVQGRARVYGVSDQDVADLETRFPDLKGRFKRFSQIANMEIDFEDPSKRLTVEVAREMMAQLREICFRWIGEVPELRDLKTIGELDEGKPGIE